MTYDEFSQVRDVIDRSLRAGAPAVLATLVAREGHSYRDVGAMMATSVALETAGGVSGGCLEEYIARQGRELLRDRASVLMNFDTAAETPDRPRLGCGGRLEILVERADDEHVRFLDAVLSAMRRSDRAATCVRFNENGSASCTTRSRAVVVDGAVVFGESPGRPVLQAVADVVALRESLTFGPPGERVSVAYVWPQPRLIVLGARDDARPLVAIAKTAGWHVTVVDRRARLATRDRFPDADVVVIDDWDTAVNDIDRNAWTATVVMTHSVDDDRQILAALLAGGGSSDVADYIGLLGPSVRMDRLWADLPASARSRVRSPVGLSLGNKSPAAVAVAIVAELIAWRRNRVIDSPIQLAKR